MVGPLVSSLSPLIAIPAIIQVGGAEGWAAVAVGQSLGAAGALVVMFGWGVVGPQQVARAGEAEQRHIYWVSGLMRAALFLLVAPVLVVCTLMLVSGPAATLAAAGVTCAAFVAQGLNASWFLIGQARPGALTLLDSLPRTAGVLAAAGLAVATQQLLAYAAVALVVELAIATSSFGLLAKRGKSLRASVGEAAAAGRGQWPLMVSAIFSTGYTRLAVPLVSLVSYSAVPVFAALDRVGTLGRTGMRPFVNSFQAWVASSTGPEFWRRSSLASAVVTGVGAAGGLLVFALLPEVLGPAIFGSLSIAPAQAAVVGAVLVCVAGSYSATMFGLIPLGRISAVSLSTVTASCLAVPAIAVLAAGGGATGAMLGVLGAEFVVVTWQAMLVYRARRASTATS